MTYTFTTVNNLINFSYAERSTVILYNDLGILSFYFPRISIALKSALANIITINTAIDTVVINGTIYNPGNGQTTYQALMILFGSMSAYTGSTETDPIFLGSPAGAITSTQIAHWETAYGWGNSHTRYTHTQAVPSSSWVITHNLNSYPPVTVVDSGNTVVIGDVHYNDLNQLTITFSASFAGSAYL